MRTGSRKPEQDAAPRSRAGRRAERPRVLVVDDDERNLLAISEVLDGHRRGRLRAIGRGGAAVPAQGRVRRHPARRADAGPRRLRDGAR